MKKVISAKCIAEGEALPNFYGLAYWDWNRDIAICYPIPFNVLIRILHSFWCCLKCGLLPHWFEREMARAGSKERHAITSLYEAKLQIEKEKLDAAIEIIIRIQNMFKEVNNGTC